MISTSLHKTIDSAKRKSRRGLTLIEAAMVLTILALVIGGVMLYYSTASTERQTQAAASQLGMIQQATRSAYASQSTYTGVSETTLQPFMPKSMAVGTGLNSAFNGAIIVASTDPSTFTVELDAVPQTACQKLATMDFGRSTQALTIGGTDSGGIPTSVADAGKLCGASANVMVWTFQ